MSLSRRDFFSRLLPKVNPPITPAAPQPGPTDAGPLPPPSTQDVPAEDSTSSTVAPGTPSFAVISSRYCLAFQGSPCSMCAEQCPESGAIIVEDGLPRIDIDLCTGCQICHQVCPAPNNAVRIVPRQKQSGTS